METDYIAISIGIVTTFLIGWKLGKLQTNDTIKQTTQNFIDTLKLSGIISSAKEIHPNKNNRVVMPVRKILTCVYNIEPYKRTPI